MKHFFVEPCPGCFENQLRDLSQQPGNPLFMGAGDFTLARMAEALARLVADGDMTIAVYYLHSETLSKLSTLLFREAVKTAIVLYDVTEMDLEQFPEIKTIQHPVRAGIISVKNDKRHLMVAGNLTQGSASGSLECFTMVNDQEQQTAVHRHLHRLVTHNL